MAIGEALDAKPNLVHIKEEDGPGKKLGRYFKVKLWPTLILLQEGIEVSRVVRPTKHDDLHDLLVKLND